MSKLPETPGTETPRTITIGGFTGLPYPQDGLLRIGGVVFDLETGDLSYDLQEAREKRLLPLGPKVEDVPTM